MNEAREIEWNKQMVESLIYHFRSVDGDISMNVRFRTDVDKEHAYQSAVYIESLDIGAMCTGVTYEDVVKNMHDSMMEYHLKDNISSKDSNKIDALDEILHLSIQAYQIGDSKHPIKRAKEV